MCVARSGFRMCRRVSESRVSSEGLRALAVEEIVPLIYPEQLVVIASLSPELREEYRQDLRIGAGKVLAAAEPFIRELVLGEVVEWLREGESEELRTHAMRFGVPPEDTLAFWIQHKFGGSR